MALNYGKKLLKSTELKGTLLPMLLLSFLAAISALGFNAHEVAPDFSQWFFLQNFLHLLLLGLNLEIFLLQEHANGLDWGSHRQNAEFMEILSETSVSRTRDTRHMSKMGEI